MTQKGHRKNRPFRVTTKHINYERQLLSDIAEQVLGGGLLHADVGEELLSGIFQRGPEDVDHIVDNEEAVVVPLADVDGNGWIHLFQIEMPFVDGSATQFHSLL